MKISFHLEDIKNSFQKLTKRFPGETVIVITITSIFMYAIYAEIFTGWIGRALYALVVTFFFVLATTLYRETKKEKKGHIYLYVVPILYGIWFYFINSYAGNYDLGANVFFLLHVFGFGLTILFSPYINKLFCKNENTIQYTNYFTLVFWTMLMSWIVGGAVLLLGYIAIGSVTELFNLTGEFFRGKIYAYWATIAISLITPLYALIHFPEFEEIKRHSYDTNRFFSFLVRFVGMPFILIYFIILYAYSVKVLSNFHDWPNGIISWLVIGFSLFGYVVYIFSESYVNEGKFIAIFRKYLPLAVLPQILMLFYAIYLRIAQYDITMNRYFVVIFGLWLTIISIYYIFSKQKNILIIPATLTLISLLISFGPWGVFSLPLDRQYNRFIENIEKVGILQNGQIIALNKTLDSEQENEIVSQVQYLCSYRTCEKIRPLFEKTLRDAEEVDKKSWNSYNKNKNYTGLSSWEAASAINKAMNIKHRYRDSAIQNEKYIRLSTEYKQRDSYYPINLIGYEKLVQVVGTNISAPSSEFISINPDNETLTIRDGANTETLSISNIIASLSAKHGNTSSYQIDQKDLEFILVGNKHEIRVILENFSYKNPKYEEKNEERYNNTMSINGMALIKNK